MTRSGSSSRRRPPQRPPAPRALVEPWMRWMEMVDDLEKEVALRKGGSGYIPFDTKNSYIKREVYKYFLIEVNDPGFAHLADIVEYYRGKEIKTIGRKLFDNPFYWIFLALKENTALHILKGDIIPFSEALINGFKNRVPQQFIIAFTHQYGDSTSPPGGFNLLSTGNSYEAISKFYKFSEDRLEDYWKDHAVAMRALLTSEEADGSSVRETNIGLLTATYEIVNLFKNRDCLKIIELDVRDKARVPATPRFSKNPYYWALLAIQTNDKQLKSWRLSELATLLVYAHAHKVPSYLLIGFIYQSGGIKAIRRQIRGERSEDWLAAFADDPDKYQRWELRL